MLCPWQQPCSSGRALRSADSSLGASWRPHASTWPRGRSPLAPAEAQGPSAVPIEALWACGILLDMQTPLCVRPLTADERATLETGLRSSSAFTVRRCQILLASDRGPGRRPRLRTTCAAPIRQCATHCMRSTSAVSRRCSRTRHAPHTCATIFTPGVCESPPGAVTPESPDIRHATSRWTLALAAEVSFAQGLTPRRVSDEAIVWRCAACG